MTQLQEEPARHRDRGGSTTHGVASATVRLLVVTGDQLVRECLARALGEVRGFDVVGVAADPSQAGAAIARVLPRVALVGPIDPGGTDLATVRRLVLGAPSCHVVLLAERPTRTAVVRAVDAGALGLVPLSASLADLVTVIRGAASGCLTVEREALDVASSPDRHLTEREQAILRLTALGTPTKEIAGQLYLSPGTVRNITSSLIKKLGGRNRFDTARLAEEGGLL